MTTDGAPDAVVAGAAELGRAVRGARVRAGISQAELAGDARVGRQWLVGLELGDKNSAPLDMVLRVLAALDLTVTLKPPEPRPAPAGPIITATQILRRYTPGA